MVPGSVGSPERSVWCGLVPPHPTPYADALAVTHDAELWTGDRELLVDGGWRWHDLRPAGA
jgi:hypothetical protein